MPRSPFVESHSNNALWEVPMDKVVSSTPGPLTITEYVRTDLESVAREEARRRRPGYAPKAGIHRIN